jgi:hypothetical protein
MGVPTIVNRCASGFIVTVVVIVLAALCAGIAAFLPPIFPPAFAHDSWISRGGLKNSAGEWCCGTGDCGRMDPDTVGVTSAGYRVKGSLTIVGTNERIFIDETVPFSESQPSPDGSYVRCHRPDRTRRCFFAPPPNS